MNPIILFSFFYNPLVVFFLFWAKKFFEDSAPACSSTNLYISQDVACCLCACSLFGNSFLFLRIPFFPHLANSQSLKTQFEHWILGKTFPSTHLPAIKSDREPFPRFSECPVRICGVFPQTVCKDHILFLFTPPLLGTEPVNNW